GTLMFEYKGKIIHVDPVSREADYGKMPKADLILVTHAHSDHLDKRAIGQIRREDTRIILDQESAAKLNEGTVMANGDVHTVLGLTIEAIPAYNTTENRQRFHPQGRDNGYLISFGDKRVYVAGDTENHPQMMALRQIDIAFLPMNQPYTMTPEQVAAATVAIRPKVLYPYHYGNTDPNRLIELLQGIAGVEVRIRKLE
ncbi:MAG: MBL fold metallo-hydrolase, partial [Spirochaetaceae bacterium]